MSTLLRSRITAQHGAETCVVLDALIRASREPDHAFAILEALAERRPDLRSRLISAANSASRRGLVPIRTARQAMIRLGMVSASKILLEASDRQERTVAWAA